MKKLLILISISLLLVINLYSYETFYGCVTKKDYLNTMLEGKSNFIIHYTTKTFLVKFHPIDDAIKGCEKTIWIKRGCVDTARCMKTINLLWDMQNRYLFNPYGLSRREFFELHANSNGSGQQGSMSGTRMRTGK